MGMGTENQVFISLGESSEIVPLTIAADEKHCKSDIRENHETPTSYSAPPPVLLTLPSDQFLASFLGPSAIQGVQASRLRYWDSCSKQAL